MLAILRESRYNKFTMIYLNIYFENMQINTRHFIGQDSDNTVINGCGERDLFMGVWAYFIISKP